MGGDAPRRGHGHGSPASSPASHVITHGDLAEAVAEQHRAIDDALARMAARRRLRRPAPADPAAR